MNIKIKRLTNWIWHHCFSGFCILFVFCTIVLTVFTYLSADTRSIYFTYHENTYLELEEQAYDIVEKWNTLEHPYVKSYETVLCSDHPSVSVTLKVYNYGTDYQNVSTVRRYSSQGEQIAVNIFSFAFISAVASVVFLVAVFVILFVLRFFCWVIITISALQQQRQKRK